MNEIVVAKCGTPVIVVNALQWVKQLPFEKSFNDI